MNKCNVSERVSVQLWDSTKESKRVLIAKEIPFWFLVMPVNFAFVGLSELWKEINGIFDWVAGKINEKCYWDLLGFAGEIAADKANNRKNLH
jgi:hypothetical protein